MGLQEYCQAKRKTRAIEMKVTEEHIERINQMNFDLRYTNYELRCTNDD